MLKGRINLIILMTLILILAVECFITGMVFERNHSYLFKEKFAQDKKYTGESFEECVNLSTREKVYCVNSVVMSFYNYTERNEFLYNSTDGTLEDVIKNGGDCYDYTNIYQETFESMGLKTERVRYQKRDYGHTFLVVFNNTEKGYCIVDQVAVVCSDD